jgi:hypothetical protein
MAELGALGLGVSLAARVPANAADEVLGTRRHGGQDISARPDLIGDIDGVDRLLSVMLKANPGAA